MPQLPSPSELARVALHHYKDVLPNKGKPRETDEWTVYAAILATTTTTTTIASSSKDDDAAQQTVVVVSCATGTKCTAVHDNKKDKEDATTPSAIDAILHDSHAEVLARRGMMRVLWQEIIRYDNDGKLDAEGCSGLRLLSKLPNGKFQLQSNVQLHLYVSDSPCGDASIYSLPTTPAVDSSSSSNSGVQFTGAKVIVSPATQVSLSDVGARGLLHHCIAREPTHQLLGRLRTKSGRSNLQTHRRSDSLSCSDKIVRWSILGMQGRALLHYLQQPIRLSSLVVSRDARSTCALGQQEALTRAIAQRVQAVQKEMRDANLLRGSNINKDTADQTHKGSNTALDDDEWLCPQVHVVEETFARGKASSEHAKEMMASRKRKRDDTKEKPIKLSPTGVCLNWNMIDNNVELTVGARGVRQGKKRHDLAAVTSRLSRHGLWQVARQISSYASYDEAKAKETRQDAWRQCIFNRGPLAGWIFRGRDNGNVDHETTTKRDEQETTER